MALLTYNWQEPNFDSLIANALHGEQLQQQAAIQQLEQQRLAKQQAASLALQLRQESRIADQEKFRQALESAQSARQDAATASMTAHRKAEDAYKYGAGRPIVASADGGDDDLASRYTYDPESGSLVTPVSSFGGLSDVLSGQDNGMFGTGGSSVLKEDGTPITEADIPDVRAHPEKYHDNPEPYAAFPQAMYASGAVKKGEKYWVSAAGPDGQQRWSQITARDVGPGAAGRGLDLSPGALKSLGVDTDAKVNVYLPGGESAIAGGGSKTPSYAAMIRNLPPEQQDRAMRQIAVRNATAQNHPRQTRLVSGTDGKSYRVGDDGVPIDPLPPGVQLGRMNSLYSNRFKTMYQDAQGNRYEQMADGSWKDGNEPPDGVPITQIGTRTIGTADVNVSHITAQRAQALQEEKEAQRQLDKMAKEEEKKGDATQGYPWRQDGKMYRVNSAGQREEVTSQSDYDAMVKRADEAAHYAAVIKSARARQEALQNQIDSRGSNSYAPAAPVPSGSRVQTAANAPAPLSETGEAASSPTQAAPSNPAAPAPSTAEAQSRANQAQKAFDSGDKAAAEEHALRALKLDPNNAAARAVIHKLEAPPAASSPTVTTKQQFDALASGAVYVGSDGKKYRKP